MSAIEFVKKFGICEVKKQLENPRLVYGEQVDCQFMYDLKQIVEAFELVKKHGGLNNAKYDAQYLFADWDYRAPMERRLKKAIELVEKCSEID